jgi:hypothetical protein
MKCPLCGGPLHIDRADQFACERGHRVQGGELAETAAARVTMAFWMAIEALESEAAALRLLAAEQGGNEQLAEQAADDARVLREMAAAHLAPLGRHGDGS